MSRIDAVLCDWGGTPTPWHDIDLVAQWRVYAQAYDEHNADELCIRVGVLSNTLWPREHHEAVFARDGVLGLLDGAVYSSEIHDTTPHPEAFRAAMQAVWHAAPSPRDHGNLVGCAGVSARKFP